MKRFTTKRKLFIILVILTLSSCAKVHRCGGGYSNLHNNQNQIQKEA
jgi:hypothetical protein